MAYTLVQSSDFVGEIQIANKAQDDVSADLAYFINKYQPVFLKQLFGMDFYPIFESELNGEVPTDRMVALVTSTPMISAMDNFVYYYYIRDQVTKTVGVGNVQTASQNATLTSGGKKLSRAWNEMVKYVYEIIYYLQANSEIYPEYVTPSWLIWRMCDQYWWQQDYFLYPLGFRNIPDIFNSINDMNI